MTKKKILYITGSRADFGLMTPVLLAIQKSRKLSLKVYATGMHLMPQFGRTFREVKNIFPGARKIPAVFKIGDQSGSAHFIGEFSVKLAKILETEKPDLVLILGDRIEMLCIAAVCLYQNIATAHIHGGERSSTVDESARHAITKLSSLHFTATAEAAKRIEKMGEEHWRILRVGAPALDVIMHEELPSKLEVRKFLRIGRSDQFMLVVEHPSESANESAREMKETLSAVKAFPLIKVVVYPNADAGGEAIIREIEKERNNPQFRIFKSISHRMFLALERDAALWLGNSSAALIESASFKTPVINIGNRQKGRTRGRNVIDAVQLRGEIRSAIRRALYNKHFRSKLKRLASPYGDGRSARRIVACLERLPFNAALLNKQISY